jgi:hypothetical protein
VSRASWVWSICSRSQSMARATEFI